MKNEHAERIYGRLQEATHISGYSFNRACKELETLIDTDQWQTVGPGYADFSKFTRTLDFSPFNLNAPDRKRLAEKMRKAGASNRAIADALGVDHVTIGFDLGGENSPLNKDTTKGESVPSGENSPPHVSHNTGDSEWFTPSEYIEAARKVMGRIDLDPASTERANTVVKAERFYCFEDNGLAHEWHGAIWLNPPYSQPAVDQFCAKLVAEVANARVQCACVLVNNATETKWFQSLAKIAGAICFPSGRVRFWHPDKAEAAMPLQGQAIISVGNDPTVFTTAFVPFGFTLT